MRWLGVGIVVVILAAYALAQYIPSRGGSATYIAGTVTLEPGTQVQLAQSTLDALVTPTCTEKFNEIWVVTTTPSAIPPDGGLTNRDYITIQNIEDSAKVVCYRGDPTGLTLGCNTGNFGWVIDAPFGSYTFSARESDPITCRGCSGNVKLNVVEAACTP